MKTRAFNDKTPRNAIRGSKHGSEFNTSHKTERKKLALPYYAAIIAEHQRFSEFIDTKSNEAEKSSSRSEKSKRRKKAAKNLPNTFVRQAVVMVVGTTLVANSYQVMTGGPSLLDMLSATPASAADATVTSNSSQSDETEDNNAVPTGEPEWIWGEDNETATLRIPGVGEAEASVEKEETPAGCTTDGLAVYTATAVLNDNEYSDSREEILPATGHSFGEPELTTDSDGNTVFKYHCDGCGQDFEMSYLIEKE